MNKQWKNLRAHDISEMHFEMGKVQRKLIANKFLWSLWLFQVLLPLFAVIRYIALRAQQHTYTSCDTNSAQILTTKTEIH